MLISAIKEGALQVSGSQLPDSLSPLTIDMSNFQLVI